MTRAEYTVIWDGRVSAPHRGYLVAMVHETRAPGPEDEERIVPHGGTQGGINKRARTLAIFQTVLGKRALTVSQIAEASGFNTSTVARVVKRGVREGIITPAGLVARQMGPDTMTYRWGTDRPAVTGKRCARCGHDVPESQFPQSAKSPDGLASWCRACFTAAQRKRRAA